MELFKLLGTIAIDASGANKAIDDTTGNAQQSESKMTAAFKKIGGAVATFFAAEKIVEFGKTCLDTAAEMNATSSQFSQVFGDLEDNASKSLSNIADQAGIAENRMKGSYTKIAAFAKTTGMETADALSLADRAMVAVADSAAFYDRTLEETTESLQSFLKGNYENDAALGLSCTETTRNAAANELYGKSFKDLSEQQKQLTLLKMVEDANELSGALGQASRESDTWTNQTGNLKQAWTDLQATLGKPILPAITKVVGKLADKLGGVTGKVSEFIEFLQDGEKVTTAFKDGLSKVFSPEFLANAESMGQRLANFIERFKSSAIDTFSGKLEKLFNTFQSYWGTAQPIVEAFLTNFMVKIENLMLTVETVVLPIVSLFIDYILELANTIYTSVQPAIDNITTTFTEGFAYISDTYTEYILPVITNFIDMITELYNNNQDKIAKIGVLFSTAFNLIGSIINWFYTDIIQGVLVPAIEFIVGFVNEHMDTIKQIFQSALEYAEGIIDFFIALFKGDWEGMWEAVKNIQKSAVAIVKNYFTLLKNYIFSILSVIGKKISEEWAKFATTIKTKAQEILATVKQIFQNIKDAIAKKFDEIDKQTGGKLTTIVTTIKTKFNEAKTAVTGIFDNIKTSISKKLDEVQTSVKNQVDKLKGLFKFEWTLPKIKTPHFKVTGGEAPWGFGGKGSLPKVSVEWYKHGGIMTDPTIFGYNPASGNIMAGGEAGAEAIAPIDTLQKYIREAVGDNSGEEAVLERVLAVLERMDKNMVKYMQEAMTGMEVKWNDRELGRMVKTYA